MLIAIPACDKDVALVLKNLEWCDKLGAPYEHTALVTHDDGFNAGPVIDAAAKRFKGVKVCKYSRWNGDQRWPQPQNWCWQHTARFIESRKLGPWLWWEADATPLKPGWVDILAEEYAKGGKEFMGYLVDEHDGHMNGVGVYPDNISTYTINGMLCRAAPFDIVMRDEIRRRVHRANHLIHWTPESVSFNSHEEVLATVKSSAVLFHKCKDGTLIDHLPEPKRLFPLSFSAKSELKPNRRPFCFLMLGRHGDLVNILPIIQKRYDGHRVPLVVSKLCASMFDGTTYVEPIAIDSTPDQISIGFDYAKEHFENVSCVQVWGDSSAKSHFESHYNRDAWFMAGEIDSFNNRSMRPLFDGRSPKREQELLRHVSRDNRPILAMAIQGGFSSPFRDYKHIEQMLLKKFGDAYNIVDLCGIRCERVCDLLGVIEASSILVTADSVHLHLAAATDTPVVALLSDRSQWAQTAPRCNALVALDYRSAMVNADVIYNAIASVTPKAPVAGVPIIIHAVEQHQEKPDEAERNRKARKSWLELYKTRKVVSAHYCEPYIRTGASIGKKPVPYLKDVLRYALDKARDCDVVMWTNADTIVSPEIIPQVHQAIGFGGPIATMRRLDYNTRKAHPGRDLCAFRASWLREHWDSIPDFLIGFAEYDNWMALAARRELGRDSTAKQLFQDVDPCDMKPGAVTHIEHDAEWNSTNRYINPGNVYNVKLLKAWCKKHQPRVKFDRRGHVDWGV